MRENIDITEENGGMHHWGPGAYDVRQDGRRVVLHIGPTGADQPTWLVTLDSETAEAMARSLHRAALDTAAPE